MKEKQELNIKLDKLQENNDALKDINAELKTTNAVLTEKVTTLLADANKNTKNNDADSIFLSFKEEIEGLVKQGKKKSEILRILQNKDGFNLGQSTFYNLFDKHITS